MSNTCPWCNKSDTFIKRYQTPFTRKQCDKQIGVFRFINGKMELEATGHREGVKLEDHYYCELCMQPVSNTLTKIQ